MKIIILFLLFCSLTAFAGKSDFESLLASYNDCWQTLKYYSDQALGIDRSQWKSYREVYIAGIYCRRQVENYRREILSMIEANPSVTLGGFLKFFQKSRQQINYTAFRELVEYNAKYLSGMRHTPELADTRVRAIEEVAVLCESTPEPRQDKRIAALIERKYFFGHESDAERMKRRDQSGFSTIVNERFNSVEYLHGLTPILSQDDSFLNTGEVLLIFDFEKPCYERGVIELYNLLDQNLIPGIFFFQLYNGIPERLLHFQTGSDIRVAILGFSQENQDDTILQSSFREVFDRVKRESRGIMNLTHKDPLFIRPLMDIIPDNYVKYLFSDLGLITLGWTIDSRDWLEEDPDKTFSILQKELDRRGRGIILFHAVYPNTVALLGKTLSYLSDNHWKIVNDRPVLDAYFWKKY
ncbi:MAG: hypothetical protein PHW04_02455 [Candidatus Wallbacteria bacterium]|nr:hypothetical protein [Candidatus Wallbacteria bacterium]